MAQLSGEPALRSPKRVPVIHGKYAPAPGAAGLRVLPAAAHRGWDEVRSVARESEGARTKGDSAAALRGREGPHRDEQLRFATRVGKYSGDLVQNARRKNQRSDRRPARGVPEKSR